MREVRSSDTWPGPTWLLARSGRDAAQLLPRVLPAVGTVRFKSVAARPRIGDAIEVAVVARRAHHEITESCDEMFKF